MALDKNDVKVIKEVFKDVFEEEVDKLGLATKKDVEDVVLDAINTVVIPGMDNMAKDIKDELGMKIDSLDRKFTAQQNRLDRHNESIEKLEKIHPQNSHLAAI